MFGFFHRLAFRLGRIAMQLEGFLRVKEAAQILGVSPNTVRSWGAAGKITEYRHPINNYRLYKKNELDRIVNKLMKSATNKRKSRA